MYRPNINISFSDRYDGIFYHRYLINTTSVQVGIKGGKKNLVQFVDDPTAPDGKVKGKKIAVAPGLDRNTGAFVYTSF